MQIKQLGNAALCLQRLQAYVTCGDLTEKGFPGDFPADQTGSGQNKPVSQAGQECKDACYCKQAFTIKEPY